MGALRGTYAGSVIHVVYVYKDMTAHIIFFPSSLVFLFLFEKVSFRKPPNHWFMEVSHTNKVQKL